MSQGFGNLFEIELLPACECRRRRALLLAFGDSNDNDSNEP